MPAALGVAASLCALAAGGVRLDGDVSTAVRATRVEFDATAADGSGTTSTTGQLELVPKLVVLGELGPRFAVEYAPRFFLPIDLAEGAPELTSRASFEDRAELLHRGGVLLEQGFRSVRAAFRGDVTYGKTDLLQGGAATAEPVPTTGRIRILNSRATASVSSTPARRLTLSAEAGAFRTGGADAEARASLPIQQGVLLGAELGWTASRRSRLSAGIGSTLARTAETDAAYARASLGWRWLASRATTLRVGAGLVASSSSPPGTDTVRGLAPWAEVGVEHAAAGGDLSQGLAVQLEPAIDQITGQIQQRLEARGSLSWRATRAWTLSAEARAAASRYSSGGFDAGTSQVTSRIATLALRAGRSFSGGARLGLGAWNRWQDSVQAGVPSFLESGGLVELSFPIPGL